MAKFTETKTPYEILVRFEQNGSIAGAHVGWLERVYKESEIINQSQKVESIGIGEQNGFPLDSILSTLHTNALKDIDALTAENAQKKLIIAQLEEKIAKLESNEKTN